MKTYTQTNIGRKQQTVTAPCHATRHSRIVCAVGIRRSYFSEEEMCDCFSFLFPLCQNLNNEFASWLLRQIIFWIATRTQLRLIKEYPHRALGPMNFQKWIRKAMQKWKTKKEQTPPKFQLFTFVLGISKQDKKQWQTTISDQGCTFHEHKGRVPPFATFQRGRSRRERTADNNPLTLFFSSWNNRKRYATTHYELRKTKRPSKNKTHARIPTTSSHAFS